MRCCLHRQLAVGDGVELHPLHQLLDRRSRCSTLSSRLFFGMPSCAWYSLSAASCRVLSSSSSRSASASSVFTTSVCFRTSSATWRLNCGVLVVALVAHRARDDERRPRLVDEDRVHLVDDRVRVLALHPLLEREHHVVAQVVEAELVVGAVGDVGVVGGAALGRGGLGVVEAGRP